LKRIIAYAGALVDEDDLVLPMPEGADESYAIEVYLMVADTMVDPIDYGVNAFYESGAVVVTCGGEPPQQNDCKVVLVEPEVISSPATEPIDEE